MISNHDLFTSTYEKLLHMYKDSTSLRKQVGFEYFSPFPPKRGKNKFGHFAITELCNSTDSLNRWI